MEKWEKPVLSILGVSKTKGTPVFEDLNNLPVVEINTEDTVSIASYSGTFCVENSGSSSSSEEDENEQ